MTSWRDVAAAVLAEEPSAAPTVDRYGLSPELYASLARLAKLPPPPKLSPGSYWSEIVSDAQRIAREGWASSALSLGWMVADLYGVGARDDWDFQGLAVWLAGRQIVALDDRLCIAGVAKSRGIFERGGLRHGRLPVVVPVMLWEFGRAPKTT